MIVADGVSIKNSDTRHKYGSAMAEYLHYLCGLSDQDRDTGGGDGFTFYAQFGKRIMTCDEQGFVDVITFANEDDANSAFRDADEAYWAWCADDDETESAELFEVVAELAQGESWHVEDLGGGLSGMAVTLPDGGQLVAAYVDGRWTVCRYSSDGDELPTGPFCDRLAVALDGIAPNG